MGRAGPRSRCICVEGRPERRKAVGMRPERPTLYLPGHLPYTAPDRTHYTCRLPRTRPPRPPTLYPPGRLPYTAHPPLLPAPPSYVPHGPTFAKSYGNYLLIVLLKYRNVVDWVPILTSLGTLQYLSQCTTIGVHITILRCRRKGTSSITLHF